MPKVGRIEWLDRFEMAAGSGQAIVSSGPDLSPP
jgi:hypothetical protein